MSVFDKELIINGKAIRSPEQQVWKNMKDIEALQAKIKDAYKTSEALTSASVSVATADTNVGTAEEGWLMTEDGLLFNITGNDGDNVLLQFYADLKGPQGDTGPSGASLEIDDSSTSATKVWSSQKTNNAIELISDKGIYYTEVQPTLDGGVYKLNVSDLGNNNTYTWQKYGDLIIYIDGNGNPTELWKCVGLNGTHTVMTVEKIADYAKGKQLYQHNMILDNNNMYCYLQIVTDNNTPFTFDTLKKWFADNCYQKAYQATGMIRDSGNNYNLTAVILNYWNGTIGDFYAIYNKYSTVVTYQTVIISSLNELADTPIAL